MPKSRRHFKDHELKQLRSYLLARGQSFDTPSGKVFIYDADWNDKRVASMFPEWDERTIGYKRQELVGDPVTTEAVTISLEQRVVQLQSLVVWLAQQQYAVPEDLLPRPTMQPKRVPTAKVEKLLVAITEKCNDIDGPIGRRTLLKLGAEAGFLSEKATRASARHMVRAGRLLQFKGKQRGTTLFAMPMSGYDKRHN